MAHPLMQQHAAEGLHHGLSGAQGGVFGDDKAVPRLTIIKALGPANAGDLLRGEGMLQA
ncbi:hypothetical protein SAMN02745166_05004 [Prosthecobacter debontii]|uniref:Uncharacterized protein n=1 Tax=Prosthecobacter debontii TaxID=48467 RepID=A0A1T4Z445_9BACT|nr:hypothetical protein [Prosthecobacter debontii]SKB08716.1 hypothetical protein SAMN02745166_05004 [Prosthecobacter debontii]